MDPITVTASVLRVTTSCITAAKTLHDIRCAWSRAPVTVDSLCSQLRLTAASLSRIQSMLLDDADILKGSLEVLATFDTTLTACTVLTALLDRHMQNINKGILDTTGASWRSKFLTLWNEDEIKELTSQLNAQHGALGVLLDLLQMDSLLEMKRQLRRHEELLHTIASNTRRLRRTYSIAAPKSILEVDASSVSVVEKFIQRDSAEPFETSILNSEVYKKALAGILGPASDECSDETLTIASPTRQSDYSLISHTQQPIGTRSSDSTLWPDAPSWAADFLSFKRTYGQTLYGYSAKSDLETGKDFLTFNCDDLVVDVQRLDATQFLGCRIDRAGTKYEPRGVIRREHFRLIFVLRKPILAIVRRDKPCRDLPGFLVYNHNIEVKVIHFSHSHKVYVTSGSDAGWVGWGELYIDNDARQKIDCILNYFKCPPADLSSSPPSNLPLEARRKIAEMQTWQECASIAQLIANHQANEKGSCAKRVEDSERLQTLAGLNFH